MIPDIIVYDSKKDRWRVGIENSLKIMMKDREDGKLAKAKQRHPYYREQLPLFTNLDEVCERPAPVTVEDITLRTSSLSVRNIRQKSIDDEVIAIHTRKPKRRSSLPTFKPIEEEGQAIEMTSISEMSAQGSAGSTKVDTSVEIEDIFPQEGLNEDQEVTFMSSPIITSYPARIDEEADEEADEDLAVEDLFPQDDNVPEQQQESSQASRRQSYK